MFQVGSIIRFDTFYFKNGASPKAKFFIVLYSDCNDMLLASMPTRSDHVPKTVQVVHGCIDIPEGCFNCYVFERNKVVCDDSGFTFDMTTFLYGEQIDEHSILHLLNTHPVPGIDYIICGQLNKKEFDAVIKCFSSSPTVRKRYKRLLLGK